MANADNEKRFDKIDVQLERIAAAVVNGFDRIDKKLETKADAADLQKALGLLVCMIGLKKLQSVLI